MFPSCSNSGKTTRPHIGSSGSALVRQPRLSFFGWYRLPSILPAVLTETLALLAATSWVKFSHNLIYLGAPTVSVIFE
jgi:hypothetical protein